MVNTEIKLITFLAAKDGEAIYSQQKQALKLTMAQIISSLFQIRLEFKKVGETIKLFMHDLYQIPYTVRVTNRNSRG